MLHEFNKQVRLAKKPGLGNCSPMIEYTAATSRTIHVTNSFDLLTASGRASTMKRAMVRISITVLMTAALSVTMAGESQVSKELIKPETDGTFLLTVFLRHDQSMTLAQIKAHQERTGFLKMFPPEDVEVVSWHVVMGIGQVVTLRVPPHKLRAVNLAVEKGAWGAFRSEFYPTYDLWPIIRHTKRELADE